MNFGAILRAAFFLGADRVITTAKNWSAEEYLVAHICYSSVLYLQLYSDSSGEQGQLWSHGIDDCLLSL